ncbi:RIB43A-like with coiled-coils protein 2 [Megalops cyprinoides]|uniref:RIB43A-like with coiled-coils protein 2 n=1 Tax=Megalops cyprinoides TaxID=118141 RepID=UPI0018647BC0|nr:RIB43A-like with coiled-coils protein 2 [Megalops cyprinoides]
MSKIELQSDRIAAANLERRRNRELQRKDRIFNAKVRTIGVDKDALDYQVEERRKREEKEAEELRAYAADLERQDQVACLLEQRQKQDRRQLEKAIQQFRQDFQQPESQREFDINNPNLLREQEGEQALPGLAGQDPDSEERRRRQQEQLREWSLQQQRELEMARQQQKYEDQQYDLSRVALANRAIELQKISEERQRAVATATKEFNLAKVAEAAKRQHREQEQEEENNRVEILNQLKAGELSVGQEESSSVVGLARLWLNKGVSAEYKKHIIDTQLQQAEAKRRASVARQQQELLDDRVRVESARTALLLERQQARISRQLRRAQDNTNAQLAEAQSAQKKYLDKQEYSNIPDDSYFSQFNTTSR